MTRHARQRTDRKGGGSNDPALIYGWHSALAALQNPRRRIRRLYGTANALDRLGEIGLRDLPNPVDVREIDRVTGAGAVHQGIAVLCDPLAEADIADVEDAELIVVLDQVTDPHNVGAIMRSCAALGASAIVLTERHGPRESGVLAKAASGAVEHVSLVRVKNLARAMEALAEFGFFRIGLDSGHADSLEDFRIPGKAALVLGAEGKGMRRLTRESCDQLFRLEMPGKIKSLNVSNAAALALYIVSRRPSA
jgi:23S rRNA (guanosine2251-2'-O)-methyltransferase